MKVLLMKKFINSLEQIKPVHEVKNLFVTSIIKLRTFFGVSSKKFMRILTNLEELLNGSEDKQIEVISEIENSFNVYFKNREYILENFLVYNLYNNCMKGIKDMDLSEPILKTIVQFAMLKKFLSVEWNNYKEDFNEENIVDVISAFYREVEHNKSYMSILEKNIKESGYDTIAYLTILVR